MQYRKDRYGEDLSLLGYGCMRFTKKGSSIDIDKTEKEINAVIDKYNRTQPPYKRIVKVIIRKEPFIKSTTRKIKRDTVH